MAGKRIFISYSRHDTEYVSALAKALRDEGFDVWFDKNIRTGTDWDDTLETELKKADTIVLVMSKTSVASENVKDEMSYVMNLGKIINPIKIEDCDVPLRLGRKQFVDFTVMGPQAGFERLVTDIRKNLELGDDDLRKGKGRLILPKPVPTPTPTPNRRSTIKPYLIGGMVAVFLLVIVAFELEEDTEDSEDFDYGNFTSAQIDDSDWADAVNSHSIDNYLRYIKNAGPNGKYVADAQDLIFSPLPNEGIVPFQDINGNRYFSKIMFANQNGILGFGPDDNYPPNQYDILSSNGTIQVYNESNNQIIPDVNILDGDKVEVMRVDYYNDNSIWMKVAYSGR
ncbi:MAG: toll/interleukin-1 receptor domain-containing protein [Aequorivita sp.]